MNGGKTYAYYNWTVEHAWVPPVYFDNLTPPPYNTSYANDTTPAPELAEHDPYHAALDQQLGRERAQPWVRPDFVIKADDDSFVMLAELEARLRVELHTRPTQPSEKPIRHALLSPSTLDSDGTDIAPRAVARADTLASEVASRTDELSSISAFMSLLENSTLPARNGTFARSPDPLIYWGYLVKNRFMAGELYALSFALSMWIASDPQVKMMMRGAEDKQTAKWMRAYPRADEVRWVSERCWIYDHPRAGTVYVFF